MPFRATSCKTVRVSPSQERYEVSTSEDRQRPSRVGYDPYPSGTRSRVELVVLEAISEALRRTGSGASALLAGPFPSGGPVPVEDRLRSPVPLHEKPDVGL